VLASASIYCILALATVWLSAAKDCSPAATPSISTPAVEATT
jgi:hypothetical protein